MDWKKLIDDLRARGYTQTRIGNELGLSQIWVSDIIRGKYKDLRWADGQALIKLHAAVTKKPQKKAA